MRSINLVFFSNLHRNNVKEKRYALFNLILLLACCCLSFLFVSCLFLASVHSCLLNEMIMANSVLCASFDAPPSSAIYQNHVIPRLPEVPWGSRWGVCCLASYPGFSRRSKSWSISWQLWTEWQAAGQVFGYMRKYICVFDILTYMQAKYFYKYVSHKWKGLYTSEQPKRSKMASEFASVTEEEIIVL